MINTRKSNENGSVVSIILIVVGVILLIGVSVFAGWSYMNYTDQKTDVDTKIEAAVAAAVKKQADADEEKRLASEKQPNREFVGPDDYGRVTFSYPKTWSVYISKDAASGGNFEAYLNPISVPAVASDEIFALRVVIKQEDYDKAVSSYGSLVKSGKLNSTLVTVNGTTGTRFDGSFNTNLRGALVLFKIRDKTVTIRTDANTFLSDFESIVSSIKFND